MQGVLASSAVDEGDADVRPLAADADLRRPERGEKKALAQRSGTRGGEALLGALLVRCEGINKVDGKRCNIHACMKSLKEARVLNKGHPLCAHHAHQLPKLRERLETRDCCRCQMPFWVPLNTSMTGFMCVECREADSS